jgi:HTH-type transcriptional regulator, competence development regulator
VTRNLTASPTPGFAAFLRKRRAELASADPRRYSLRQVAYRVGIEPSYLSKVERGLEPPPGEATALALARELNLDADLLLAMAEKVSSELQVIIRKRPNCSQISSAL